MAGHGDRKRRTWSTPRPHHRVGRPSEGLTLATASSAHGEGSGGGLLGPCRSANPARITDRANGVQVSRLNGATEPDALASREPSLGSMAALARSPGGRRANPPGDRSCLAHELRWPPAMTFDRPRWVSRSTEGCALQPTSLPRTELRLVRVGPPALVGLILPVTTLGTAVPGSVTDHRRLPGPFSLETSVRRSRSLLADDAPRGLAARRHGNLRHVPPPGCLGGRPPGGPAPFRVDNGPRAFSGSWGRCSWRGQRPSPSPPSSSVVTGHRDPRSTPQRLPIPASGPTT